MGWYFLAELSLRDLLSDSGAGGVTAERSLAHTLREVGMAPEWVDVIEMDLAGFAQDALAQINQGVVEIPGWIRIFRQDQRIGDSRAVTVGSEQVQPEPALEHAQTIQNTGAIMNRGWGYFLVERGGNCPVGSTASRWKSVDLYLYNEGE